MFSFNNRVPGTLINSSIKISDLLEYILIVYIINITQKFVSEEKHQPFTSELGPQPKDQHACSTFCTRRMIVFQCSFKDTALGCYPGLHEFHKSDWYFLFQIFKVFFFR